MFQVIEWKKQRVPKNRKEVKKLFIRYFVVKNIMIFIEREPTKRNFLFPSPPPTPLSGEGGRLRRE